MRKGRVNLATRTGPQSVTFDVNFLDNPNPIPMVILMAAMATFIAANYPGAIPITPPEEVFDDAKLLQCLNYYGNGNWAAPMWFIGMEPGIKANQNELFDRTRFTIHCVATLLNNGMIDMLDFFNEYTQTPGNVLLPRNMPSYNRLHNQVYMPYNLATGIGVPVPPADPRVSCQRNNRYALFELLPLPSPGIGNWMYGNKSNLPQLANRAAYMAAVLPGRIAHFMDQIAAFNPQTIVMHGVGNSNHYAQIAGVPLAAFAPPPPPIIIPPRLAIRIYQQAVGTPKYIIMTQPSAPGVTNAYLNNIATLL